MKSRNVAVDLEGSSTLPCDKRPDLVPLMLDGIPVCKVPRAEFAQWMDHFRDLKIRGGDKMISPHTEIVGFDKQR